jgi:hypothetical protein
MRCLIQFPDTVQFARIGNDLNSHAEDLEFCTSNDFDLGVFRVR